MFFAVYSEKKSIFKDFFIWRKSKKKQNKERGVGKIE